MDEILSGAFVLLAAALVFGLPFALLLFSRVAQTERRIERIERYLSTLPHPVPPAERRPVEPLPAPAPPPPAPAAGEPIVVATVVPEVEREAIAWETLIGRRAIGWVAVVVLLFGTGFFIRYAFQNRWIGPLGRVSLGVLGGTALAGCGRNYYRRGWRVFSQMLSAAGVVLLYLATFAAFGFYHLVAQREAALLMVLIVAESALLALRYEAPAIALMAVVGGLLTPILMHTEHDQYVSLFTYLIVLDGGIVWLLLRRRWPAIGLLGLLGTHVLFWVWYGENYHPEKRAWAIGFQAAVFLLFFGHTLLVCQTRERSNLEELVRIPLTAGLWFAAVYVLFDDDHHDWLGTAAVGMAAVYAAAARWLLTRRPDDSWTLATALGIAAGFLALAIPLQADAEWVALGWTAEAAVLWWFGVRTRAPVLRAMAAVVTAMAVARIVVVDTPWINRPPFTPILNRYAMPTLSAVACLGCGIFAARRWLARLAQPELLAVMLASAGCVLMAWMVVSVDIMGYFQLLTEQAARELRWLGQTWLSGFWAVYATAVLAGGFVARQAWLRWTALGLYAVTVAKVFLFDMAGLDELYRVIAFFVLAMVLGAAAWAYHRFQFARR